MEVSKSNLVRWCFWFFFGNAVLFWLIGLYYLPTLSFIDISYLDIHNKIILKIFTITAYLGYLGTLALLPALLLLPLIYFIPKRNLIFSIAIIIATVMTLLLVVDVVTYKLYRFHLNSMILDLAVNGIQQSIWEMTWIERLIFVVILAGLFVIESLYAAWAWSYFLKKKFQQGMVKWMISVVGFSFFISYFILYLTSNSIVNHVMTDQARFLPFYRKTLSLFIPEKTACQVLNRIAVSSFEKPIKNNFPLNYPLQNTVCTQNNKPKNILFIIIDTWRFDMLNSAITPNLASFAKKSWNFKNHFSGGNATEPGVFSLFYGLPAYYWTSMQEQHHGPVLIDELIKQNYQMGIFASATLKFPAFNQTVFVNVKNLREESQGATPYNRDETITQEFINFLNHTSKQTNPFFGFLFYDGAHSYCNFDEDLKPLSPAVTNCNHMELTNESNPIPYFNRYKNALIIIDQQVKRVLEALKNNGQLKNTVVVITGDHGEEFNDNHLGYWGHASNFTHFQVQTPLIIYWPDQKPKTIRYQTTHFDLPATLMKHVLGCQGPASDYSIGHSILESNQRNYLIVGSYTGLGIVEPDRITDITSLGDFNIVQANGQSFDQANLNNETVQHVMKDLQGFFKIEGKKS